MSCDQRDKRFRVQSGSRRVLPEIQPPMKTPHRFQLLAFAVCLACATSAAVLPNVHTVAQAVDDHYNHMQSLQANFTEIYQGSGVDRVDSGTLWLKKSGKMRLEYRSPKE